jgi:hypothetical protein
VLCLCCDEPSTNERPVNTQQLATNRRRIDAVPFLCCHKLTSPFPMYSVLLFYVRRASQVDEDP